MLPTMKDASTLLLSLKNYLEKNYPSIVAEYERSQKSFDELFKVGDLVECVSYDIRGNVVLCWRLFFVKKVSRTEDAGNGSAWGDDYYVFSEIKTGEGPVNLIEIDSEWWKVLRPVRK